MDKITRSGYDEFIAFIMIGFERYESIYCIHQCICVTIVLDLNPQSLTTLIALMLDSIFLYKQLNQEQEPA